jgi:hypothetical protein
MNLQRASVVLRERPLLEVLDLSLRFVLGIDVRIYVRLALVLLGPALAACLAARWLLEWEWVWVWTLALVLGGSLQGAFTIAAGRLMFSETVPVRSVLAELLRRLPSHLGALIASRVMIALGGLFIVLAPFVWARMLWVSEAVLLEEARAFDALRRSSRFEAHHAKNGFAALMSFLIGTMLAIVIAELLGQGLVGFVLQSGAPFGSLQDGGSPYALAGYFASVPLVATARFLAYIDARTRRDGWDIQIRFIAMETAARERIA